MQISLHQFERIDGQMQAILCMGPFETCADPRGYIAAENRLHDLCIDALGFGHANAFASALDCAADVVARALLGQVEVIDENATPNA